MIKQRTYIRCIAVGLQTAVFEIPEWKPGVWFELSKGSVPPQQRGYLHPGFRCNVTVDIHAEQKDQLNIHSWRLD